ncbi:hypothetical protein ACN27J_06100 [Solwaraspora sp. WMMB762]|uniref:hypothetical protein n=1 Tax=Solwaraspora sp. WMMB762 TaxID=3404120 RepID=UPI003B926BEE
MIADARIDLIGAIGRRVLTTLLPDRRVLTKARIVKRAISKYNACGPDIDRASYRATIDITVMTSR